MEKQQQIIKRGEYIKSLQQFISSSKEVVHDFLQKLNWTEEATLYKENEKPLHICPLNPAHRVSEDNMNKHLEMCRWHQNGYTDKCVPLPPASATTPASVVLDKELQAQVILEAAAKNPKLHISSNVSERDIPQTSDRIFSDFTTDERRVLYDYVVSKTAAFLPTPKEFSLPTQPESKSGPMTREQQLSAERDAKRRRIRYRTKVHTKSKNYTEVMHEVINNQMLAFEDWVKDHHGVTDSSIADQLEKKNADVVDVEKKEMIWLDWDHRSNPHLRWKNILEREKRRAERKESDKSKEKDDYKIKHDTNNKGSSKDKYTYDRNKQSKVYDSHKYQRSYSNERKDRYKTESHKKERTESYYYKGDSSRNNEESESHKRGNVKNKYDSKSRERESHKQTKGRVDHYKKERSVESSKCTDVDDIKHHEIDYIIKTKTEHNDDSDPENLHHVRKKLKLYDDCSLKQEKGQDSCDSDKSNHNYRSSHSKKSKKKKSKHKKHRHNNKKRKKHKREQSSPRSNHYNSSEDSSDL